MWGSGSGPWRSEWGTDLGPYRVCGAPTVGPCSGLIEPGIVDTELLCSGVQGFGLKIWDPPLVL